MGLSQNRLSEIERGNGSFTAEQFLTILKSFNVATSHFVEPIAHAQLIQNALARFGASHLLESSDAVGLEALDEIHRVVCEALADGTSRLVVATCPVLVRNAKAISLQRMYRMLYEVGVETRLPWVVDNASLAIDAVLVTRRASALTKLLREAQVMFRLFLDFATRNMRPREPDILDASVRSPQTVATLEQHLSPVSRRWKIVSRVQPEDFARALEAALGSG